MFESTCVESFRHPPGPIRFIGTLLATLCQFALRYEIVHHYFALMYVHRGMPDVFQLGARRSDGASGRNADFRDDPSAFGIATARSLGFGR